MKIAITGEKGFIGIHLIQYFRNILKYEVIELGRDYLVQLSKVKEIDWLIHGACIHRHPDPEILIALNLKLTNDTINCLIENNIKCNIVFLSSIYENQDTPYGQSKRDAKAAFNNYCNSIKKDFISYKLQNIFGKYAVPNKTSFIATFCYNLHNDLNINYNKNEINLVYIDDVIPIIASFEERDFLSTKSSVDKIYYLLKYFHENYINNKFPELNSKFELDLYQTYLSYLNYKL